MPAAWWPWALRDAVAASSPAVTHANLRELTRELRSLCRTMSCKRTLSPFWMGIGLHDLKNTASSFRHVASAALSPGIPYLGPTVVIGTGPVGDIPAFEDVPLIELSGWVVSSDGRVAVSAVADTGATLDSFESMASPDVWAALRRSSALPARFRLRAAGCVSPCQFSLRDATGSVVGVITASNRGAGLAPGPQGSIDSLTVTRPKTISPPRWVFQWLVKFSAISALIGVVTIVTGLRKGTLLLFIGIGGAVLLRLLMMSYIDASLAPARQHQYVYPLGAMLAPLGFAAFGLTANNRERAFVRSLMTRLPGRIRSLAGRGAMMVDGLLGLSSRSAKTGPDLAMTV